MMEDENEHIPEEERKKSVTENCEFTDEKSGAENEDEELSSSGGEPESISEKDDEPVRYLEDDTEEG